MNNYLGITTTHQDYKYFGDNPFMPAHHPPGMPRNARRARRSRPSASQGTSCQAQAMRANNPIGTKSIAFFLLLSKEIDKVKNPFSGVS
jgi:hypothetical protein